MARPKKLTNDRWLQIVGDTMVALELAKQARGAAGRIPEFTDAGHFDELEKRLKATLERWQEKQPPADC